MEILFLCIKIFFVRILDVSLGTVRTIMTVKGKKILASTISFVEVFIWFMIVREALNTNNTSIWIAIAYASGYAAGTFIGGTISEKFIKGNFTVQVITSKRAMVAYLKEQGFGVSVLNVKNDDDITEKYMLFIEINKMRFDNLKKMIEKYDDKAFVVVNETKTVYNGYFRK
ncbi:MAG: DUF5698 domain-containing protein [Bacilli bacterium]|nr:DUF5698 domain-containing protein [Bacilli bacterium]